MSVNLAQKYDKLAEGFAERSWANLEFDMQRRLMIATRWGKALVPGDSVLEFGCGDGYLAKLFVQQGVQYRGVDFSSKMIAMAQRRLQTESQATFLVMDIDRMSLSESVDAVVSYMGAFFTFVKDPLALLHRLRPNIHKKIILDLNPRGNVSLRQATGMLTEAGFRNVTWRPFFVPTQRKFPVAALKTLAACEDIPVLRKLPLPWKFDLLIKGEIDSHERGLNTRR